MKKALLIIILAAFVSFNIVFAEDPPTIVWDKAFDSGNDDWWGDVTVDAAGFVYVTGETFNGADWDWHTIKYNADGDTVWSRTWDSGQGVEDYAHSIAVDNTGNVYVAGWFPNGVDNDWKVTKYDSDGNELWTDELDTGGDEGAHSVAVDAAGYVYVTGDNLIGASFDYQTIKYDPSNGSHIWERTFDSGVSEGAWAIAVDPAGYVYVAGQGHSGVDFDWLTIKYDENGDTVWTRTYDSGANETVSANAIAVDNTGNVYVGGTVENATNDWLIVKYDANGTFVREIIYDSGDSDRAWDVEVDATGFVYVTGDFYNGTDDDWRTVKYDADGNVQWDVEYVTGNIEGGRGLAVDNAGFVYVTGVSHNGTNWDARTIKYEQHVGVAEQPTPSSHSSEPSSVALEVADNLSSVPSIRYLLPQGQCGNLTFYSADGCKLESYKLDPAQTTFTWSTDNPAGVYFTRLVAAHQSVTAKIILTR